MDIKEKLGIQSRISKLALVSGMKHDLPAWFWSQPKWRQNIYKIICVFLEFSLIIQTVSCTVLVFKVGRSDIGIFSETICSLIYLAVGVGKAHMLYRHRDLLHEMLRNVHAVAEKFEENPLGNDQYLVVHNK